MFHSLIDSLLEFNSGLLRRVPRPIRRLLYSFTWGMAIKKGSIRNKYPAMNLVVGYAEKELRGWFKMLHLTKKVFVRYSFLSHFFFRKIFILMRVPPLFNLIEEKFPFWTRMYTDYQDKLKRK
jgi:hypothetical protein